MDDSCLDNVNVSVPETDVVKEVSVDTAMDVLEKEVSGSTSVGVNVAVSKNKKKKLKTNSAKCGVNSIAQDNLGVSIPETHVIEKVPSNLTASVLQNEVLGGVNNVVSKKSKRKWKKEALAGVNSDMGVVEKEVSVSAGVISTMGVLEKDVSAVVNDVVSKKRKRKCKRLDNLSVDNPKTDVEEVPVQSNLTTSPEKFHIPPIDTTMGVLEKEVSGGVSKKKKRKPKRSTMEMTCLDNVSVGIPKTDVREEVPVESNLTSSGEKFHISSVDTMNGVLEKEVSGGRDIVVSNSRKRIAKLKETCLDNVSVGIPKADVLEEVPVQLNLTSSPEKVHISPVDTTLGVLEKEISGGVNALVSKKKKRKPKRSSIEMTCLDNVSDGISKTDGIEEVLVESNLTSSPEKFHISPVDTRNGELEKEVSGGVGAVVSKKKKRKPKHSTMEITCLDNVSVGIPKTDVREEVPVESNLTSSGEKFHISLIDTMNGVLEKEVSASASASASAGVDDVVSKKKKRKPKHSTMEMTRLDHVSVGIPKTDVREEVRVESNLTSSGEKLVDTMNGVLEKEVLASAGVDDVVSKKKKRKPKHSTMEMTCLDNVSVGIPKTDVREEVPVESNLSSSGEKLVDTMNGVLEKEVSASAGVDDVVSKKKKRKPKHSTMEMTCLDNVSVGIPKTDAPEEVQVQVNLTSSGEKLHISPIDTTVGVVDKEVSASAEVDDVVSKKKKRKPKHSTMEMTCLDNVSVGIPKTDAPEEVQVQLNLTSSGEKLHISPIDTTVGVVDKEVSASAEVDDVVSKKKKRKPKHSTMEMTCLDNVSVGIPKTDAPEEGQVQLNLTSSGEKLYISPIDTTVGVVDKEVSASAEVDDVVSKKKKRKPKHSTMEMTCLDNVSVGIPKTDAPEEVQVQLNLTSSGEKLHISPIDTTVGVVDKEVSASAEVDDVVSKKKKRRPKHSTMEMTCLDNVSVGIPKTDAPEEVQVQLNLTSSGEKLHISPIDTTVGVVDKEVSASAEVDDVVSKKKKRKPKHSTMEMTCLDNVSVGIPKTDAPEEVQVQLNLTSSGEKLHISPIDTTVGVLDKEVSASAGVDDVVSKKRKRKPKRLDNVNVGTPKTNVLEEVPVESNLTCSPEKLRISPVDTPMDVLEKEVLGGVNVSVSKKRKRESKLKKVNDCSSIESTCLDNVSVKPVSGVTDNISLSDINNDGMANDHPVATCSVNVDSNGKPLDTTTILKSRRKLLVLDVNGLLADIVPHCPKRFKPDFTLAKKIVFKRPFCDDFLQFCFEKFDVGIWSSRTKKNLTRAVDLLMNNMKNKLLFCWDGSRCTKTGFKTLEDKHKPLVLKELKNLWESKANHLPSQRGFYDKSNTILLDDSPYKALRNPPYTAIHPKAYSFADVKDKSLGPNGDIRLYLERLAEAENVQKFIQANPFGQKSITNAHPSWNFYSKIVRNQAGKRNCNYQRL